MIWRSARSSLSSPTVRARRTPEETSSNAVELPEMAGILVEKHRELLEDTQAEMEQGL